MIYFEKKNEKGNVVVSNLTADIVLEKTKRKDFNSLSGTIGIITDDPDMLNSSKVFKKVGDACSIAFDLIHKYFVEQTIAYAHTLKKLQGQLNQKVESVAQSPMLVHTNNYEEQRDIVVNYITQHPEQAADTFIYLQKRIFELGAHMSSFEILHMGEEMDLDTRSHNLKKILSNIWHAFDDVFKDQGLTHHFMFDDEMAESNKIELDYKTINAAIYNFFDNVSKYAKPYSEVRFYLKLQENDCFKLIISMRSLRIEKDELDKIFEIGYRGKHCLNEEGTGVGMFVIKKALELNNLSLEIVPDYSDMEEYDTRQYILNKFIIFGKIA